MGFENPVVGGTALRIPAIQSPGYSPGAAGWIIKIDGSAEFNNVLIRGGTVTQGTILVYNGAPAAGNLVLSIAATAGVDGFGNAYVAGEGLYGASGQVVAQDAAGDQAKLSGNIGGGGLLSALPGLAMQLVHNAGDPAVVGALDDGSHTNLSLLLASPSPVVGGLPITNFAQMQLIGADSGPTQIAMDAANVTVNAGFNINSSAEIDTYASNTTHSFIPAVGNAGTATWTTRSGYWVQLGPLRFVNVSLVVNAPGSGAGIVTVTMPFNVERTLRQAITMHTESVGPNGSHVGNGECVFFAGGGGAVSDRLRTSSNDATNRDLNITGADLLAGGQITIQGWLLAS
jgi:hypothetical protein